MDKKIILGCSILVGLGAYLMRFNYENALEIQAEIIQEQEARIQQLELAYFEKECITELIEYRVENAYNVVFTNYYTGDADGSTNKVGAGYTTDQFKVNENGWYTYNGRVVLAAATWAGIHSNYGNLAEVNDIPSGYHIHHYGDEVTFMFDGKEYEGVILDTCFSAMIDNGEGAQRYDIFIAGKDKAFGKKVGIMYE